MESFEKLNVVLRCLEKNKPQLLSAEEINESIIKEKEVIIGVSDTVLILNKLIKDGYVSSEEDDSSEVQPPHSGKKIKRYILTFDGQLFIEKDGYRIKKGLGGKVVIVFIAVLIIILYNLILMLLWLVK